MIHIGNAIKNHLTEQGRTVTWFAGELECTRMNVYKIFKRESVETSLLYKISVITRHDFFKDLSDYYRKNPLR